jgi:hypothetical protein
MPAHPDSGRRHIPGRTAWLLKIGQRLRAEYAAVEQPVPERLAALIKELEAQKAIAPPSSCSNNGFGIRQAR